MAGKRNQGKTDTVEQIEQPETTEQTEQIDTVEQTEQTEQTDTDTDTDTLEQTEQTDTETDTVEQTEQIDTVEQTEQPEAIKQKPNKQKPEKGNTTTVTEKEVSKIPEFVKVRVTHGYDLLHPYTNKCVKTELLEFPCDNWMLAQLQAGFIDMYTVNNERLLWKSGKLVYAK